MSARSSLQPTPILQNPATGNSAAERIDRVSTCMRQIQANAEQICNDAADIEDARFLAETIVHACRNFLASRSTSITEIPPVDCEPADRAKLDSLSARELEIFTHLAEGRSAAEIATKLSRSSKTINNHRTRILQKLGLRNSTELVRLALRNGLVTV